mmetsp:Transcript_21346/g.72297  ORF Transcript_21346/g.72297 Transcript_21346/m.72297 type:complete len:248 (+) Transcript_21346:82-825(+)
MPIWPGIPWPGMPIGGLGTEPGGGGTLPRGGGPPMPMPPCIWPGMPMGGRMPIWPCICACMPPIWPIWWCIMPCGGMPGGMRGGAMPIMPRGGMPGGMRGMPCIGPPMPSIMRLGIMCCCCCISCIMGARPPSMAMPMPPMPPMPPGMPPMPPPPGGPPPSSSSPPPACPSFSWCHSSCSALTSLSTTRSLPSLRMNVALVTSPSNLASESTRVPPGICAVNTTLRGETTSTDKAPSETASRPTKST